MMDLGCKNLAQPDLGEWKEIETGNKKCKE